VRSPWSLNKGVDERPLRELPSLGMESKFSGSGRLKLNSGPGAIVHKYREGKMKRTLERELKKPTLAKMEANETWLCRTEYCGNDACVATARAALLRTQPFRDASRRLRHRRLTRCKTNPSCAALAAAAAIRVSIAQAAGKRAQHFHTGTEATARNVWRGSEVLTCGEYVGKR